VRTAVASAEKSAVDCRRAAPRKRPRCAKTAAFSAEGVDMRHANARLYASWMLFVGACGSSAGGTQPAEAPQASGAEQPAQAPANKLKASIKRVFKQFRIIRRALVHPQVPWHAKAVAGCAVLYVVSPIQIIPNFIPIIGQMDDVLVVTLAVKYLKRYVPQDVLYECESNSCIFRKPKVLVSQVAGALTNTES